MTAPAPRYRRLRVVLASAAVGVIGLALCGLGATVDPRQAAFSYLAAFSAWLSVALGALLMVMISHLSGASWFVALRRSAETAAATLPLFALLFVPLLFVLPELYPWARPPATLDEHLRAALAAKGTYFERPFFIARAVAYFVVWTATALLLRRWSVRRDADPADPAPVRRQRVLAALGLPPVAFALTWASFDWLMSLAPEWVSTVFGVYWFVGGFVAALGLFAVLAFVLRRDGVLAEALTESHVHALGKLTLTFVIFWGYIAYAQYFIIWIADIPAEAGWYLPRVTGPWRPVALLLVIGHFVIPFAALLSWRLKRSPRALAAVGAWLLVMHCVDAYWLVLPALHPRTAIPHWLDLAAFAGVGGVALALWAMGMSRGVAAPVGDPLWESGLEYATR